MPLQMIFVMTTKQLLIIVMRLSSAQRLGGLTSTTPTPQDALSVTEVSGFKFWKSMTATVIPRHSSLISSTYLVVFSIYTSISNSDWQMTVRVSRFTVSGVSQSPWWMQTFIPRTRSHLGQLRNVDTTTTTTHLNSLIRMHSTVLWCIAVYGKQYLQELSTIE